MMEKRTPRSKFPFLPPFFLLLFFFSSSKVRGESPFEIQQRSQVFLLPGQSFNVSFAHYSGYVTLDGESGKALFYWFFEAVDNPDSKPLVLWLNGGPGCSSIGYGLAEELGPFHVTADGKGIFWNQYSWNQVANILFLDSPVGVGFSYSKNSNDLWNNGDASTGHYVPQLAQAIVRSQQLTGETSINLRGFMVGNPLTDDFYDHIGIFQFLWSAGLISDQTYKLLNNLCDHESFLHASEECGRILDVASDELGNIDPYSIFTPLCTGTVTFSRNKLLKRMRIGKISEKYDPCTEKHSTVYFNLPEVQKSIHVDPSFASSKWEACKDVIFDNWKDSTTSILPIYKELIDYGLRIWIFSGDTDSVIPVTATRYNVDALNLSTVIPWHAWYDDGQVGGWTQVYKGLTLVTVRGAGHHVPLQRPKQALSVFKQFLSGTPMPTLSEHASF